ncbi:MAG: peptide chain release factor N(5)-glutamine methyltransferase [Bacteroides sp.]|nr:peptide chain release factor N(5)-glutamine methyltransferase [Bacteroides sp.]
MTIDELRINTVKTLSQHYPTKEAEWMVRIMFEELKEYSQVDLAIKGADQASDFLVDKFGKITDRLLHDEPIQYIFGNTRFYGLTLKVTPDTLIPRPETEELVDMIVKDYGNLSDMHGFDICTGSGCIAIALARNLPFARIDAIDISDKAIAIAKSNAAMTKTAVNFTVGDALSLPQSDNGTYDFIVSNPPYIAESERATMESNVIDYEPSIALFVPDDDPLRFYTAIAEYAEHALKHSGNLYFEINPLFANRLKEYMQARGWDDIDVVRDMHGNNRFLKATRR